MKSEVSGAATVRKFTRRMDRVEQILPTLATKVDLESFATKDDLKAFATKEDLKAFATKEDLKAFATKDDLKACATKDDLKACATKDDLKAFPSRDEMRDAIQEAVGQVRVLFEAQTHEIRLIAEAFNAHLGRHTALEGRVDDHDTALASQDLRMRQGDAPAGRRRRQV